MVRHRMDQQAMTLAKTLPGDDSMCSPQFGEKRRFVIAAMMNVAASAELQNHGVEGANELNHQFVRQTPQPIDNFHQGEPLAKHQMVDDRQRQDGRRTPAVVHRTSLGPAPSQSARGIGKVGDHRDHSAVSLLPQRFVQMVDAGRIGVERDDTVGRSRRHAGESPRIATQIPHQGAAPPRRKSSR